MSASNLLFKSFVLFLCTFLLSCQTESQKLEKTQKLYWEKAQKQNTIKAYLALDSISPEGVYHDLAIKKIDSIRKSFDAKCLVVVRCKRENLVTRNQSTHEESNISYYGTINHKQSGWYDVKWAKTPAIYLWRQKCAGGDVDFEDNLENVESGILYLKTPPHEGVYNDIGPVDLSLTDEQIAELFNIDFSSSSKEDSTGSFSNKNQSEPVYTVRVDGDIWTEKGIFLNLK